MRKTGMRHNAIVLAVMCLAIGLSACGRADREPRLLNIKSNEEGGPDEFAILPNKPLVLPEDYSALPAPGGTNLTEPTPGDDAIIALGGDPNAGTNDGGLVSYATRFGVTPSIRSQLASEDLEFRRRNDGRVLERLFNVNVYYKAYRLSLIHI